MNPVPPRVPNTRFTLRATTDPAVSPKNCDDSQLSELAENSTEEWVLPKAGKRSPQSRGETCAAPPTHIPLAALSPPGANHLAHAPAWPDSIAALSSLEASLRHAAARHPSSLTALISSGIDLMATVLDQSRAELRTEAETVQNRLWNMGEKVPRSKRGRKRGQHQKKKCECILRAGKKMKKRDRNAALAAGAIVCTCKV